MKIKAILEQKPTVSFEVFPPKQWDKIEGTKAEADKEKPSSSGFIFLKKKGDWFHEISFSESIGLIGIKR